MTERPRETGDWTFETEVHFARGARGRKELNVGAEPEVPPEEVGNIPHVTKLLALAHRLDGLLASGAVESYAELAAVAGVTRARITQIMDLLLLAPDIQEEVLFLPRTTQGRDPVTERELRAVVRQLEWKRQRRVCRRTGNFESQRRRNSGRSSAEAMG